MSTDGVIALNICRGSVNGDDFIRGNIITNMQEYDGVARRSIVIMDNCSIPEAIQHFREAGTVIFYPLTHQI
jgi:hypothetical protein